MNSMKFTTHRFEIPFEKFGEPIYLIPFGDIHRFADNCCEEKWLEFLDWCKQKEKECPGRVFYFGMGDYDDFASTSERWAIKVSKFHDTTVRYLEEGARLRKDMFLKEISFMKGKIIGMIEGNHHYEFESGVTSTMMMCEELGCKYLGIDSFVRLSLNPNKTGGSRVIDIWAHHGKGGGGMIGSSVNSVQKMSLVANADIYMMGDDHKKWVACTARLELSGGNGELKLHQKKILLARTGSFQLGYIPDQSNYVSAMCLAPTDLGVFTFPP